MATGCWSLGDDNMSPYSVKAFAQLVFHVACIFLKHCKQVVGGSGLGITRQWMSGGGEQDGIVDSLRNEQGVVGKDGNT